MTVIKPLELVPEWIASGWREEQFAEIKPIVKGYGDDEMRLPSCAQCSDPSSFEFRVRKLSLTH